MSGKLGEKVVLDRTSELPVRAAPTHPSCTLVPNAQTDVARSGKHVTRCRSEPTGIADVARRVRSLCCKFTTSTKYRPRRAPTVNPEYSSVSPALAGYITHSLGETRAWACAGGHRHRMPALSSPTGTGRGPGTGDRGPGTGTGVSAPCRGHRQAALEGTCRLGVPRCDGAAR